MLRSLPLLACSLLFLAPPPARAVDVGDTVLAWWAPGRAYFVATAVEKADGGYLVVFEDGDRAVVPERMIRKYDLKVGSAVIAKWTDGRYYPGKIAKVVGRAFYVHYDDGDKGWAPLSWIAVK
jgi:hypothetical protein